MFAGWWKLPDTRMFFTAKKPSWFQRTFKRVVFGWVWEPRTDVKRKRK